MKKHIFIMGLVSLLLVTGCGCSTQKDKDGNIDNNDIVEKDEPTPENPTNITNEDMIKDQIVEELQFTNTALVYDGNMTTITSQVENKSDYVVTLSTVKAYITYLDPNDNEKVLEMDIYFGEKLNAGEVRSTTNYTDVDLRKSSKIEYKIVRE